jgi:alcohol dehydrogenase
MLPFDFQFRTRLVCGVGSVARVGELVRELGGRHVLVVTDAGIAKAGHAGRVADSIREAGLEAVVFEGVRENPDTTDVARCVEVARESGADLLVGLGGGSAMDTAKGANFLLTNGGEMRDYWGVGKAHSAMLPLVAIPTTSGTGSECQSFALISDPVTHQKMACGDVKAAARVAILDPELTLSQPVRVTACTGVDALAHALETAVTRKRTALSLLFSREAFRLILFGLPRVLVDGADLEARSAMQLGAAYAGLAIEGSMLGCAHSAANPLTARFGVVHGQAVGRMLPGVIRRNALKDEVAAGYLEHAKAAGLNSVGALVEAVEGVLEKAGLASRLSTFGVGREALPQLAAEAHGQWTRQFNPVEFSESDFCALYEEVLE